MPQVVGLNNILRNIDRAGKGVIKGVLKGMGEAAQATAKYSKVQFNRSRTGRGFSDVTGRLRRSIDAAAIEEKAAVSGYIFADTPYAEAVEHRSSGKFAYLWPAVTEMGNNIFKLLGKRAKEGMK